MGLSISIRIIHHRKVKYEKPAHLTAKKMQTRGILQDITTDLPQRGGDSSVGSQGAEVTRCRSPLAESRARIYLKPFYDDMVSFCECLIGCRSCRLSGLYAK